VGAITGEGYPRTWRNKIDRARQSKSLMNEEVGSQGGRVTRKKEEQSKKTKGC